MSYVDDFSRIVMRNVLSVSGFWFDLITSIPWSYVDLGFYLVMLPEPVVSPAKSSDLILAILHRAACAGLQVG